MTRACPARFVPGLGLVEGVVSPHAEALDSVWLDALRRLVPPLPWLRLTTAATMTVATARPPRLVPPAMSST